MKTGYELKANELNDVKVRELRLKNDDLSSEERKVIKQEIEDIKENYIVLEMASEEMRMES